MDLGGSGVQGGSVSEVPGVVATGGRVVWKRKTGSVFSESLTGDPWRGMEIVRDCGLS